MALLELSRKYIADNDLATHDDRILLTVSGGVDSMVMLSLFTRCGYRVGVAHCNFQLRGAESDEDEVLVEDEARKLRRRRSTTGASTRRPKWSARASRWRWRPGGCATHGSTP